MTEHAEVAIVDDCLNVASFLETALSREYDRRAVDSEDTAEGKAESHPGALTAADDPVVSLLYDELCV